tara:strand:- start:953 stop:1483 length:531 start_codon:yes stop_codon:yes gene_type:complete
MCRSALIPENNSDNRSEMMTPDLRPDYVWSNSDRIRNSTFSEEIEREIERHIRNSSESRRNFRFRERIRGIRPSNIRAANVDIESTPRFIQVLHNVPSVPDSIPPPVPDSIPPPMSDSIPVGDNESRLNAEHNRTDIMDRLNQLSLQEYRDEDRRFRRFYIFLRRLLYRRDRVNPS